MAIKPKRKYRSLEPGQIWVASRKSAGRGSQKRTRSESRRILYISRADVPLVCYASGASAARICKRVAFLSWIRRYKAHKALPSTGRELVLTPPPIARSGA
jgi:hypothetical protein